MKWGIFLHNTNKFYRNTAKQYDNDFWITIFNAPVHCWWSGAKYLLQECQQYHRSCLELLLEQYIDSCNVFGMMEWRLSCVFDALVSGFLLIILFIAEGCFWIFWIFCNRTVTYICLGLLTSDYPFWSTHLMQDGCFVKVLLQKPRFQIDAFQMCWFSSAYALCVFT